MKKGDYNINNIYQGGYTSLSSDYGDMFTGCLFIVNRDDHLYIYYRGSFKVDFEKGHGSGH